MRLRNFSIIAVHKNDTLQFTDMIVGFSHMSYTVTETEKHATVCVDVLNPPFEGALQPFTVVLLPEHGMSLP